MNAPEKFFLPDVQSSHEHRALAIPALIEGENPPENDHAHG